MPTIDMSSRLRLAGGTDIELLELRGPGRAACATAHGTRSMPRRRPRRQPPGRRTVVQVAPRSASSCTAIRCAAPFVRPATQVRAGQTLGLLQVGALLLPVTAPRAGIVGAIAGARTAAAVGYGTPLVELRAI